MVDVFVFFVIIQGSLFEIVTPMQLSISIYRVVICTFFNGGGSGIGRAVCKRFAQEGARVAVADVHAENAVETTKLLPGDLILIELNMVL